MSFEAAFTDLLDVEGRYSNRKSDRGGKTMYGVTEAVARANGYQGRMQDLSRDEAKRIFKAQYWDTLRLDAVAAASPRVAYELFDTGVNMGIGIAGGFLQRSLNAFNRQGADYQDLQVDGLVGPMTVSALKAFLYRRKDDGETVLLRALNALQGARYIGIAEHDHAQEDSAFGWFRTRVSIA